jgi:hypothetical protein
MLQLWEKFLRLTAGGCGDGEDIYIGNGRSISFSRAHRRRYLFHGEPGWDGNCDCFAANRAFIRGEAHGCEHRDDSLPGNLSCLYPVRNFRSDERRPLDLLGFILSAAALGCLMYGDQ